MRVFSSDRSVSGKKSGRLYLTTHRMIFNSKDAKDPMQSFSFPFVTLKVTSLFLKGFIVKSELDIYKKKIPVVFFMITCCQITVLSE